MEVGLVGRGPRVEAVAHLLSNHDVYHWAADGADDDVELPGHVREVDVREFEHTPIIFLCLPIHRLRSTSRELGGVLSGRHVLVHTTRNLELGTLDAPSEILGEETPTQRFGLLSGPFATEDVLSNRPSSAVCASQFPEVHDLVEDVLDATPFRVYRNDDLLGAEIAAAYTRIIAMLAGAAGAMELGDSLEATLFARGLAEAARFVVYRGGFEKTAFGLAGCGNLRIDTVDHGSTDATVGAEFVDREDVTSEKLRAEYGVSAHGLFNLLESLDASDAAERVDLPLLERAVGIAEGRMNAGDALRELIALPTYHE